MTEDDVLAFVKRYGYTRVTREADWKGYEAWFPSVGGPEAVVGLPLPVLVRGGRMRLVSVDECFDWLDSLPNE